MVSDVLVVLLLTALVVVDDGESGEVTLLAVRAKMFIMEKGVGWKERGAGMLKVNVPKLTIELDEAGNVDPTTFDASVLEDEGDDGTTKSVRLIMRQDHTLRVILNTAVVPAMSFQLNQKLKAAFVLFTAFDGGEAKQVQMKVKLTVRPLGSLADIVAAVERSECHQLHTTHGNDTEAARRCLGKLHDRNRTAGYSF